MCGISALVNRNDGPVSRSLLNAVNEKAKHRGPDGEGMFLADNFGLGHRRLSIIDLSPCGKQPMKKLGYVITYNGEIFNFIQLKKQLQGKGYVFTTRTDTEVILAAYDYWKEDCSSHFEGMWSFIIYDPKKNILFCSRDRFGQKPLHYTLAGNYFAITSEIKQMTELPSFRAECNLQAAFHFLNHGALNYSSETLFRHVYSVPAGYHLVYNLTTHTYTIKQWYSFRHGTVPQNISLPEAAGEFRRLFEQSVSTRLQSDVPVGASLSGGLDSSSVCCTMRMLEEEKQQKNISICWDDPYIDERPYMDAIISATGNTSIQVFPDMNELSSQCTLNKIIYHQDQPILSTSHFSEYKLYEAASSEGLTVMIDGQGADEYLGGYTDFNFYYLHGLLNRGGLMNFFHQWKKLSHSSLPMSLFLRNCVELRYRHYFPGIHPFLNHKWAKTYLEKDPGLLPGTDMFDMRNYSLHQLFVSSLPYQMHSADRNSMSHSVEARLPFLDHRLVEFTFNLPDVQKINEGYSKVVMREALHDILPEKVKNRKSKLGFPAPEAYWMRKNIQWLTQEVNEGLAAMPGMFNEKYIKSVISSFANGVKCDYNMVFRLISLARWAKIFNVSFRTLSWLPLLTTA